jgi:hypothetical protein
MAVETLLSDFDTTQFRPNEWYLDICTTVSVVDNDDRPVCAFPSVDAHPEIISHFSGLTVDDCNRLVRSKSSGYEKDEAAHLGDFAGLRIPFEGAESGVHYLQVYGTEKSLTYHLSGNQKAKRTSAANVLTNWERERGTHFIPLQNALIDASSTHSVAVRFESRVAFEVYPYVHLEIPLQTLYPWLFYLNNTVFWLVGLPVQFLPLKPVCFQGIQV